VSLTHLPEPRRPNAIHNLGDRVTLRDEHAIFVLPGEKAGKGRLRAPGIPMMSSIGRMTQSLGTTTIVKVWDAECE